MLVTRENFVIFQTNQMKVKLVMNVISNKFVLVIFVICCSTQPNYHMINSLEYEVLSVSIAKTCLM